MKISVYTLTSFIHNKEVIEQTSREFLDAVARDLNCEIEFKGENFDDYQQAEMPVIFVRTGGTEGLFKEVFDHIHGYVRLLTSGMSNSLAASMEILSFLNQNGRQGEIYHGSCPYIAHRLNLEFQVEQARQKLQGTKLGIIGAPSDWLIASCVNREAVLQKLGVEFVDIQISELVDVFHTIDPSSEEWKKMMQEENLKNFEQNLPERLQQYREGSLKIYLSLQHLIRKYDLKGFTLRCFDLLSLVKNTGCMSLALFNARGIPACCEGDVPALLTMVVGNALTGFSGFQANPSRLDVERGEITFAHCTVPFNMVERYTYDTHFESGIGVAVKGEFKLGEVTIAKLAGDLSRAYVHKAELLHNLSEVNLCRTQIVLRGEDFADYFFVNPIGNHHQIFQGDQTELFETFMRRIQK